MDHFLLSMDGEDQFEVLWGKQKLKQKQCLMFDPKLDLTHKRQRKKETEEEEVVVVVVLLQQEGRLEQQEETKQASRIIIT
jgi:hypothetical protein